jgi:hypothetical protein
LICSFNFLIFLAVCLNISTVINIKILANSNQQTQSYKFTSHIAAFLYVVLITEMLEICIQISYDQNVQLILFKELSPLKSHTISMYSSPPFIRGEVYSIQHLCDKVCQWLAACQWFSPVSSINKTYAMI